MAKPLSYTFTFSGYRIERALRLTDIPRDKIELFMKSPVLILNMYDTATALIIQIRNPTGMLYFGAGLSQKSERWIRYCQL